jgi:hypothetical protein
LFSLPTIIQSLTGQPQGSNCFFLH